MSIASTVLSPSLRHNISLITALENTAPNLAISMKKGPNLLVQDSWQK
jgi:hypothetical protein